MFDVTDWYVIAVIMFDVTDWYVIAVIMFDVRLFDCWYQVTIVSG